MKPNHYHITRLLGYLITLWSGIVFVVLNQSSADRIHTSADLLLPLFAIIMSLLVLTLGQLLLMYRKLLLSADRHYQPTPSPHEYKEAFTIRMTTWALLAMSIFTGLFAGYILAEAMRLEADSDKIYAWINICFFMVCDPVPALEIIEFAPRDAFIAITLGLVGLGLSQLAWKSWVLRKHLEIRYQTLIPPQKSSDKAHLPLFTWLQIILMVGGFIAFLCMTPFFVTGVGVGFMKMNVWGIGYATMMMVIFLSIPLVGQILHFTEQSYITAKRIDTVETTKITRKASFSGWASAFTLFYRLVVASFVIPIGMYFIITVVIATIPIASIAISAIIVFIIACFIGIGQLLAITNRLQTHFDGQSSLTNRQ